MLDDLPMSGDSDRVDSVRGAMSDMYVQMHQSWASCEAGIELSTPRSGFLEFRVP